MSSFIYDWSTIKKFHAKLDIACKTGLASGYDVGIQAKTLKCCPMGGIYNAVDCDFFAVDMVLPKERFGIFLSETWFAYKEAKNRGLFILLNCEKGSISPLGDDYFDDTSILEQLSSISCGIGPV